MEIFFDSFYFKRLAYNMAERELVETSGTRSQEIVIHIWEPVHNIIWNKRIV